MNKDTLIKVTNRNSNTVGYKIPDTGVRRQFSPRETKEITFGELQSLSYVPGGRKLLKDYLVVKDQQALKRLEIQVEPEYFYSEKDIKELLLNGSLNAFLDCLDFAPAGVIDMIKELAVTLPLDNMSKRDILSRKLGFDVTKAIEIKNAKADGEKEKESNEAASAESEVKERRVKIPQYNVVSTIEE